MKKVLFSIIFALAAISANAQQRQQPSPEDMATRQATHLKEKCQLNDEQYASIYKIFLDNGKQQFAQRDSLRKLGERPKFDQEARKARQEKMDAAIKEVLTEEQYATYSKMMKEREQSFGQHSRNGRNGNGNGGQRRRR